MTVSRLTRALLRAYRTCKMKHGCHFARLLTKDAIQVVRRRIDAFRLFRF